MKEHWNLKDILDPENFNQEIENLHNKLDKFSITYKKQAKPEMLEANFVELINQIEVMIGDLNRIYAYPMLLENADQSSKQAQYFKSLAKNIMLEYDDHTRNFYHWLKGLTTENRLDEVNAKRLFMALPKLQYSLTHDRELAKRTLSEKEEEIASKKSVNGLMVVRDLRSMIETDQTYNYLNPVTNEEITYHTTSELMNLVFSDKAEVRKNAYQALYKPYVANEQKYFTIYESVIKDWHDEATWRKYDTAIAMRNEGNNIPDSAVMNLIASCEDNITVFHKFFKRKAKLLKVAKLSRYDLYAPINAINEKDYKGEKTYTYQESKELVLRLFKEFDDDFYQKALSIFEANHIDSHPHKTKHSGAFCATITPTIKPYVLLNFVGNQRDVLTMAHELGHAVHSRFAEVQAVSTQEAPLTLAETASTLAEMIVFDYLYTQEKDLAIKEQMLITKMAETYATIIRQIYFTKFELLAHDAVVKGIQIDDFNELYYKTLTEQFGDSVEVPEVFKHEWAYIPHIVQSPFYCYSYAFGELLSLSLYVRYKKEGKSFINDIKEILAAGGSENPTKLLKKHGLDITTKSFWDDGFITIKDWYEELIKFS